MKKGTYREPVGRLLFVFVYVIFGGFSFFVTLSVCYALFFASAGLPLIDKVPFILALIFIFISWLFFHYRWIGERCCSKLIFYDDKVVWRCMGFLPVSMNYTDIKYIGVETFEDYDRGTPMFRGDEMTYIYLSDSPYPESYRRKILKLRTRQGFIKFKYMDGVCEELMKIFPPSKTENMRGFYYKMKSIDAEQQRIKQQEKRKREKNKLLKKRKSKKNK